MGKYKGIYSIFNGSYLSMTEFLFSMLNTFFKFEFFIIQVWIALHLQAGKGKIKNIFPLKKQNHSCHCAAHKYTHTYNRTANLRLPNSVSLPNLGTYHHIISLD